MGELTAEQEIFNELKKLQLNDGPCAAIIVDCDCDWCLRQKAKYMAEKRLTESK
jgi:hypothetical protein